MRRVISHIALLSGSLLLLIVGMLTYARRDDPPDWIIFSVQAGNYNSGNVDIYRVLADGTHTEKFVSSIDQNSSFWQILPNPGWLVLHDSSLGGPQLRLIHLMGYTKLVFDEASSTLWPSIYHYDRQRQRVYMTLTNDPFDNRTLWVVDLETAERTSYELPLRLNYIRYQLANEGYVYWSNHASGGDLYLVRFADLPKITRLTTVGTVASDVPFVTDSGWLYYYALHNSLDHYVDLFRMRENGTDVQLVSQQALYLPQLLNFNSGTLDRLDRIYYWSGDPQQPHLVQAKPDGSEAIDLPTTPFAGWGMGWSPDREWFYYAEEVRNPDSSSFTYGNLRRVNLHTGEDQLVWDGGRPYTLTWSTDGQTLLLMAQNANGYSYQELYQMRPDGSEATLLVDNLRSSSLTQLADVDLVVLGTWGEVGSELHILDLKTLEIRRLHEDAPPQLMRQVLATLPMPEFDWQAGWLIGLGVLMVGVGAVSTRWPPFHQRL